MREMSIANLDGISRSMVGKRSEFTIHFKKEYDYRFLSDKRELVIKILKCLYGL